MKYLFIIVACVLLFNVNLYSQEEVILKDGSVIIVNDNGTWNLKNVEASSDTLVKDCSSLIISKTDKMTGKTIIGLNEPIIVIDNAKQKPIVLSLQWKDENTFTLIAVVDHGCIEENALMIVLFRDGTKIQLGNDFGFNCKNYYVCYLGWKYHRKDQLAELLIKEIDIIRVYTSNGFLEASFNVTQSQIFLQALNCLANYKK